MTIQKFFLSFIILLFSFVAVSQPKVEVGGWQMYPSYFYGQDLVEMDGQLYYAAKNAIIAIDLKDDYSIQILNKKEGLNDIGIRCLGLSRALKILVICYDNSNIDLYNGKNVLNVPDLYNKQIPGNKTINRIFCDEKYAYLACGFGIMVVDLKKKVIKDTWFFQKESQIIEVNDVVVFDNIVYAATDFGIYQSRLDNTSINNFTTWKKVSNINSYNNNHFKQFAMLNNSIYVLKNDTIEIQTDTSDVYEVKSAIYIKNNDLWEVADIEISDDSPNFVCRFIQASQDRFFLGIDEEIWQYQWNLANNRLERERTYFWSYLAKTALYASDGRTYTVQDGGLHRGNTDYDYADRITIPGPAQDPAIAIDWKQSKLVIVHNALNDWVPAWRKADVSTLREEDWTISDGNRQLSYPADFIDVCIAPYDTSVVFAASYLQGVVELRNDTIYAVYDYTNSSLKPESDFTTRTSNVVFDDYNNLWVSNWGSSEPLSVKMQNGQWKSFSVPYTGVNGMGKILVDSRNWLWMTHDREKKLLIFNPDRSSGTITNMNSWRDLNLALKEEDGAFTYVYSIAETKDGQIWIGTDKGLKIYYSPSRLLDEPNLTPAPIVVQAIREGDTLNELVLGFESIRCIKVDGGNRKWIGTENTGVFLLSPDGRTEIFHFTKDDSPLPSNAVYSIEIDGETGDVYFGTDRGLVSFRYTATDGKENYDNLKIFPNPVREDFQGYISISGLKQDSEVKIADSQGGLVYRTVSNGGTAVWDGKRFDGRKASTGVYFVFINDENGKERKAGKILFIK